MLLFKYKNLKKEATMYNSNNNRNWRSSYHCVNNYAQSKPRAHKRKYRRFIRCEKYTATNIETGNRTCAILYINSGRVKIGDDVWRLSNPADCCDYPVLVYPSLEVAKRYYNLEEAPHSYLFNQEEKEVS